MGVRSIAIVSCVLLAACTTDLDRFKFSAPSGQPNGVTAGAGGARGGAGGNAPSPSAGAGDSGSGGRGGSGSDEPIAGGAAGDEMPPDPQSDGGPMAGSGGDDDCDSMTVYVDGDGDGYGDPTSGRPGCEAEGLVLRAGDCADDDEARNPGAEESCATEEDDNCNDAMNEGCACTSGTSQPCGTPDGAGGFLDRGECHPGTQACVDGTWSDTCDGAAGPKAETCNGLNDDCDLGTDEGVLLHRYVDGDGDLYGDVQLADGCAGGESGVVYQGGDCDDGDVLIHPGAQERCGRAGQIGDDCNAATLAHCPTDLPATPASCPTLVTGTMTLFGYDFQLWVGARNEDTPAPMVIFFFGTSSNPSSATSFYPKPVELTDQGGIFIAPSETTGMGDPVPTGIWYTGDFPIIDQVVGCALAQLNIDPRRIYATGFSTGGVQAAVMGFQRSGYIAGVLANSGGLATASSAVPQNPNELPAVVAMHGGAADVVVIDYTEASRLFTTKIAQGGGFAVDCNHGGGHAAAPAAMQQGAWKVLLDHPYGELPENYSLPSELSLTQCHVVPPP